MMKKNTPLHIAALVSPKEYNLYNDNSEHLLNHQADVNFQNNEGKTPLHIFIRKLRCTSIQQLIDKNVNVSIKNNAGKTPIEVALDEKKKIEDKRVSKIYSASHGTFAEYDRYVLAPKFIAIENIISALTKQV